MLHLLRNIKILVLITLIVIGTLLGVLHNKALKSGKPDLMGDSVRVVMKPVQVTVSGIGSLFDGAVRSLRSRKALRRENERLRREVKQLTMEVAGLREQAIEVKRLRAALDLEEQLPEKLVATRIISRRASEWYVTATIDKGRSSGIKLGQAVITHRGFLGQVIEASPTSAQVRALTDSRSGVGAIVQRSRAVGICQGQDTDLLHFTYLAKDADIKPGDIVITSGEGGVVPKGLPVGRVIAVKMEGGGFMKSATVRPSVRFDQVEEAFVVLREVE